MAKLIMALRKGEVLLLLFVLCMQMAAHTQAAGQPSSRNTGQPEHSIVEDKNQPATQTGNHEQSGDSDTNRSDQDSKAAKHKTHFHLGEVTVGAGYTNFGHSLIAPFYPYYPYGVSTIGTFHTLLFEDLIYGRLYYPPYDLTYAITKGEVRLQSLGRNKNAAVYIDNAYAGTAGKLKHMWLDPGAYDLVLKAADASSFHQRIYVLSGKTLKITPEFKMNRSTPRDEEKK
jgi:hypothetical protein